MSNGLDVDRLRVRVQAMRNALDVEGRSSVLLAAWWSGIDDEYRIAKACFVSKLIDRLKKPPGDEPRRRSRDKTPQRGMTQKEIAAVTGMSESALTEAKKGAISDEKVNRLKVLAKVRGISLPRNPKVSSDIRDNVLGMIRAMQFLSQCVGEANALLDERGYRCIRAALNCKQWQRAVLADRTEEEEELASKMLKRERVCDRNAAWLRGVFSEWIPALVVVLEEVDAILNGEGLQSDDKRSS